MSDPPVRWLPPSARAPAVLAGHDDHVLRWVLYAFSAVVIVDVLAVVSSGFELHLALNRLDGDVVTRLQADHNDTRQAIVGALQAATFVVAAAAWLVWFHRAYAAVDAVGGTRRFARGWAIGAWFVPPLLLWRPKQIADDLWAAGAAPPHAPPVLRAWWLFWLLGSGLGTVYFRLHDNGSPAHMRDGAVADMATEAINGIAAVLACVVAIGIAERLEARAVRRP